MANKCKFGGWFADVNYRPKRKTSRGWFNINYKYSREMMLKLNPDQSKIPDFNANDSTYNADYDFEKANKRFEVSLSNEMNKNTAELDGIGASLTAQKSQGTDSSGSLSNTTDGTCYYDANDESNCYDKGASFFDNLTNTDVLTKDDLWNMRERAGYGNWKRELKINQETFGPIALAYAYSHRCGNNELTNPLIKVSHSQPLFSGYPYSNQRVSNQTNVPPYYQYMGARSQIPVFEPINFTNSDSRRLPYFDHHYSRPYNRMQTLPLHPLKDRSPGFDHMKFSNPFPRSYDYRHQRNSWI